MLQFALKLVVAVLCCAGLALAQSFEELVQDAEAKLRSKDAAAALPLADAAVKLSPERWDGHFVRAIALLSLGRANDALASAEAAAARAPADRKEAVQKLVERCRPSGGGQRASLVLREAEAAQKEGLDDLAARKFAEAYELDATQTSAALKAAGLYVTLEQFAAAVKLLKVLGESADEAVRTKARDLAEKIRVRVAEPLRAHLDAARAALDGNQLATAKEEIAKAEALFDDGEMHYLAAKLAVREKRLAEALQHLKAAKIARAVTVEVVRQDADMAVLAKDKAAAEWMGNAFGAKLVEALKSTAEAPAGGAKITTSLGVVMLPVAAQTFSMGSPSNESSRRSDEQQHRVTISSSYWLAETEVTQRQWRELMGSQPWQGQFYTTTGDDVAASYVSWQDAVDFCAKLTERERAAGRLPAGYVYRLPTEAEWELACRAGSKAAYCFGDDAGRFGDFAVFGRPLEGGYAVAVKSRKANAWGFYDMHGNVWEWCADQCEYNSGVVTDTYRDGATDPLSRSGSQRVYRGGSWSGSADSCRSANRDSSEPGDRLGNLGFRPALAASSDK